MSTPEFTFIVSKVKVDAGVTSKQTYQRDQEQARQSWWEIDNKHPEAMKRRHSSFFHKKQLYFSILAEFLAFTGPDSLGESCFLCHTLVKNSWVKCDWPESL